MDQNRDILMAIRVRVNLLVGLSKFRSMVDVVADFFAEEGMERDCDAWWKYVLGVEDIIVVCLIHKFNDEILRQLREEHNKLFFSDIEYTELQKQTKSKVFAMIDTLLSCYNDQNLKAS